MEWEKGQLILKNHRVHAAGKKATIFQTLRDSGKGQALRPGDDI